MAKIGKEAETLQKIAGEQCFVVGKGARALGFRSVAWGEGAYAEGRDAVAIGPGACAIGDDAVAIGRGVHATGGEIMIQADDFPIDDFVGRLAEVRNAFTRLSQLAGVQVVNPALDLDNESEVA